MAEGVVVRYRPRPGERARARMRSCHRSPGARTSPPQIALLEPQIASSAARARPSASSTNAACKAACFDGISFLLYTVWESFETTPPRGLRCGREGNPMEKDYLIRRRPIAALLIFALPMMLGNFFQQLYTMADSAIVGRLVEAWRRWAPPIR